MNKKKLASQILVFLIFFIIIIIAILLQNNNVHTETNNSEYANLNINQEELNIFYLDQTTPNMIQRISGIFERKPLISKEI